MKIIASTGMPGCGKGAFLRHVTKRGIPSIVMRTVVEDEMREKGIEVTNKNLREYATSLRKKKGNNIVARMCIPKIEKMNSDIILIDGIRGISEVETFKEEFGDDFVMVAIVASEKTRFERLKQRGEKWDMKTFEEFKWRDEKELSWGLGEAIEKADYSIDNTSTLEEFRKNIEKVLSKINI